MHHLKEALPRLALMSRRALQLSAQPPEKAGAPAWGAMGAGDAAEAHPERINDTAIKRTKLNLFISASFIF